MTLWTQDHHRFDGMLKYCRKHNRLDDYAKYFYRWNEEEFCNIAITLCRMVDKMMMSYQKVKEKEFVEQGGIRERMTAARLNYRNDQKKTIDDLQKELYALRKENTELKTIVKKAKNN